MKTKILSLIALFMMGAVSVFAGNKTEKIKVYGNCGMCENRIEKAVNAVDGVSKANWNKDTKMLEVTFDDTKTDIHKVHMAVAKAGHDTDMHKATDEAYNNLPSCCKYDRTAEKKDAKNMHEGHMH